MNPGRIGEALFADVEATNAESTDTEIADIVTQCYEQNCESALNLHNYDQNVSGLERPLV